MLFRSGHTGHPSQEGPPTGGNRRPQPPSGGNRRPQPPPGGNRCPQPPSGGNRRPQPPPGGNRCPQPPTGGNRRPPPTQKLPQITGSPSQSLSAPEKSTLTLKSGAGATGPNTSGARSRGRNRFPRNSRGFCTPAPRPFRETPAQPPSHGPDGTLVHVAGNPSPRQIHLKPRRHDAETWGDVCGPPYSPLR